MFRMEMEGTKWNLFTIAVDSFAEKGYNNVPMRDIAKIAGIKAASVYYHFKSKEELLETIYKYYDYYYSYFMPPLESLLMLVGKEPPKKILEGALFRFDPSIQDIMDKIFIIASSQLYCDMRAHDLIYKNIFELSEIRISAILNRMIEIKLIKPLDINSFILTLTSLCHSAAIRTRTKFPIDWNVWVKSVDKLFDQIEEL